MRSARDFAASGVAGAIGCGERRCRSQARNHLRCREDGPDALPHRRFPCVGRCQRASAVRSFVAKCNGLYRATGFHGRLQQGCMEAEQGRAVGRRAFRKQGDILAGVEQGVDLGIDDLRVAAAAPPQENRVGFRRKPANQRPVAYLRFRDEGHGACRVKYKDVEPRDVVGDNEAARFDAAQRRIKLDSEDVEHLARPALLQPQAPAVPNEGKYGGNRQRPPQKVKSETGAAEHADGKCIRRCDQSLLPMKWRA